MMPQWEFLDFLRDEAAAFPGFKLQMEQPVAGFLEEHGRVAGVRLADGARASGRLTIAADGRSSLARTLLPGRKSRRSDGCLLVPRAEAAGRGNGLRGIVAPGTLMALIDRGDYWQVAFLFPKGMGEKLRGGRD